MGLRQDFSVVLDSFSISLYLGVCISIVKYRSDSYCSSFISDVDKKIAQKMIKFLPNLYLNLFSSLRLRGNVMRAQPMF